MRGNTCKAYICKAYQRLVCGIYKNDFQKLIRKTTKIINKIQAKVLGSHQKQNKTKIQMKSKCMIRHSMSLFTQAMHTNEIALKPQYHYRPTRNVQE